MFSSIGLRIAARIISPTLAPTRPTLSRALFVSHFQTRSFLSTSRLARDTVQTTSVKTHSNSAKKKPAAKKRVTAKKKTPVKKIVPLKPKKVTIPHTTVPIPKHAPSAYILFYQEYLASKPKVSDMKAATERCREIGASWRSLPEHEKQKYVEQSAVNREKRKQERLDWFNTIDPTILKEINRRRKIKGKSKLNPPKDPTVPKRVPSRFIFFILDFKKSDEAAGLPPREVAKLGGERWRQMSSSQKQVYADRREEALAARENHPTDN